MGGITKITLTCEKCLQEVEIGILKPIMLCTKCNGSLHIRQILTEDYVKNESFKNQAPSMCCFTSRIFC